MSHKPIAGLSGMSLLSGIFAYTRFGSTPSLIASVGIASAMAVSSMRIKDGMSYGLEGAAASSAVLFVPVARRALRTRAPIPAVTAVLAAASTGYYIREWLDSHQ
ncbi:hypothetical protein BCR39DRAFT_534177 [Naematelia encephala]|uniref:Transmembrane proteins 14C-domain-containing protein n=1 Tax=Naematelia encephala TaxID=71784 RepID=A0A1Y2B181_9TREE|nr:hypothetical protein BCR39DRAFT_534177 [Naematelia encephala]